MSKPSKGTVKIAILIEKDYQDMEVWYPIFRFREAGYEVVTVGTTQTSYKGKYSYPIECSTTIDKVHAKDFDAVVIPGGWAPDFLRQSSAVLKFVADMDTQGKLVAAICHGGWVLVSAGILEGRSATSYIAIRDDLLNAGAKWEDSETVVDKNLITARTVNDLPAFMKAVLRFLAE